MIEDSPRRCPRCHKRMFLELDQEFIGTRLRMEHHCWSCDWREVEYQRPKGGTGTTLADSLARLRNA